MKTILSFLLLFVCSTSWAIHATSSFQEIEEEICVCEKKLISSPGKGEKSLLHYRLACAYFYNQEIDRAFQHFLKALQHAEEKPSPIMGSAERLLYDEAMDFYLKSGSSDPIYTAKELVNKFEDSPAQNPDFIHLNFLIATAYANLGKYDLFFERFYRGYPFLKDSFLAYKTQGILFLRLAQHGRLQEERHTFQEDAYHFLTLALDRNAKDASLYKVLIFLAKDEKNDSQILTYLQRMVEHQIHIPRGDVYLYVREAVSLGEHGLAQQIIDKARSLYEYSRAISAAQDYLDQHRGEPACKNKSLEITGY